MMQIIRVGSHTSRFTLSMADSQASERATRASNRGPMVRATGMMAPRNRVRLMPYLRMTSPMVSVEPLEVGCRWFL